MTKDGACPCGSGRAYPDCCGLYHAGAVAPDAETLMRSRYSAYVLERASYLLDTWHPDTRPASLDFDEELKPRWMGLSVKAHDRLGKAEATVEFVARYKIRGRAHRLQELGRFVCQDGRWYYVDGQFPSDRGAGQDRENPAA